MGSADSSPIIIVGCWFFLSDYKEVFAKQKFG